MVAFTCTIAWASSAEPPLDGDVPAMEVVSAEPISLSQSDLLDEAVALRRVGAFAEAEGHLALASELDEGFTEQVHYQIGVLHEVQERWSKAIEVYAFVAQQWPDTATASDARFRRAYCLEELGRHKESIRAVKGLQADGRWSEDDTRTMNLHRGITEIHAGHDRKGIRRILKNLANGQDDRTWIRAKARLALVRAQVTAAGEIVLRGDKKAAKRLKQRAALISAAEKQAIVMFNLGEPEFALEGLLLLGDAYLGLYDDMLSYPPPRSIEPEDHEVYRQAVQEKALILRAKAHARYDEGVRVAARTQWVGSVTQRLTAKRDAISDVNPERQSDGAP